MTGMTRTAPRASSPAARMAALAAIPLLILAGSVAASSHRHAAAPPVVTIAVPLSNAAPAGLAGNVHGVPVRGGAILGPRRLIRVDARPFAAALAEARAAGFNDGQIVTLLERLAAGGRGNDHF